MNSHTVTFARKMKEALVKRKRVQENVAMEEERNLLNLNCRTSTFARKMKGALPMDITSLPPPVWRDKTFVYTDLDKQSLPHVKKYIVIVMKDASLLELIQVDPYKGGPIAWYWFPLSYEMTECYYYDSYILASTSYPEERLPDVKRQQQKFTRDMMILLKTFTKEALLVELEVLNEMCPTLSQDIDVFLERFKLDTTSDLYLKKLRNCIVMNLRMIQNDMLSKEIDMVHLKYTVNALKEYKTIEPMGVDALIKALESRLILNFKI